MNKSCLYFLNPQVEAQPDGNDLNLGEAYQYILSGEWVEMPDPTAHDEKPIDNEKIGNSHLDGG